ncbi:hypothetical protein C8F01DRAFT_1098562 [Mycena amicta]|nr:hypothetical protein C8F01DRAFT_1098562 [Mycena amicta]
MSVTSKTDSYVSQAVGASIAGTHSDLTTTHGLARPRPRMAGVQRSGRPLLDPETPLRNPSTIMYPSRTDPSVAPVHAGLLERKKRYTRAYKEHYFVLTSAGLHEYISSDLVNARAPVGPLFSLFLPMSLWIHQAEQTSGRTSSISRAGNMGAARPRAARPCMEFPCAESRERMMEWWNDIRMLCARYLVAREQMERSGPVAAAVRAAGYLSEDEDGSEEGSSIKEEEEDGLEYVDADGEEHGHGKPPSYSTPHRALIMGANGYLIDKKSNHARQPSNATNGGDGATVSRRPSKRQEEKAPEGRAPHANVNADGEAGKRRSRRRCLVGKVVSRRISGWGWVDADSDLDSF